MSYFINFNLFYSTLNPALFPNAYGQGGSHMPQLDGHTSPIPQLDGSEDHPNQGVAHHGGYQQFHYPQPQQYQYYYYYPEGHPQENSQGNGNYQQQILPAQTAVQPVQQQQTQHLGTKTVKKILKLKIKEFPYLEVINCNGQFSESSAYWEKMQSLKIEIFSEFLNCNFKNVF